MCALIWSCDPPASQPNFSHHVLDRRKQVNIEPAKQACERKGQIIIRKHRSLRGLRFDARSLMFFLCSCRCRTSLLWKENRRRIFGGSDVLYRVSNKCCNSRRGDVMVIRTFYCAAAHISFILGLTSYPSGSWLFGLPGTRILELG